VAPRWPDGGRKRRQTWSESAAARKAGETAAQRQASRGEVSAMACARQTSGRSPYLGEGELVVSGHRRRRGNRSKWRRSSQARVINVTAPIWYRSTEDLLALYLVYKYSE
jgi:hypothetical protein